MAQERYLIDFLFHRKGEGVDDSPQGLNSKWLKDGFSKTQAVVLELVTRIEDFGRNHVVWLDNLFTSKTLAEKLRDMGIGAARTMRTGQMEREEKEEKDSSADILKEASDEPATLSMPEITQNTLQASFLSQQIPPSQQETL
jgi:hypothetical protein